MPGVPVNTPIIAVDPDIPQPQQRVFFQAQAGNGHVWQLDGVALGDAKEEAAWPPSPGKHVLKLVDATDKVVDTVRFEVRGADMPVADGNSQD